MSVSTDLRIASLIAFAQARNCGTGPGGFQTGNTCASGKIADAAAGAAKGAATGAAIAIGVTWFPGSAVKGAAVGAAVGAVKGLYDNSMRPTRVLKTIQKLGSNEEQIASLVKKLGGSNKSSADTKSGSLTLKVKDKNGNKIFDVEMDSKRITVTPARASGRLSDSEIKDVKDIAKDNAPKQVQVVVKSQAPSYLSKLARKGFEITATQAGVLIASAAAPFVPGVGGAVAVAAAEAIAKKVK